MEYEFKPKEWVLTRDDDDDDWTLNIFSHKHGDYFYCVSSMWFQCIPFASNEHLLGTSDAPAEWNVGDIVEAKEEEFKFGDRVKGKINGNWVDAIFLYNDESDSAPYKIASKRFGDIYWVEKRDVRRA